MEEASSFDGIVEADELVESVVVFRNGRVGLIGLGDRAQLVVRVPTHTIVADLENAQAFRVVAVPAQYGRALPDLSELVSNVVKEGRGDPGFGFREGVAI